MKVSIWSVKQHTCKEERKPLSPVSDGALAVCSHVSKTPPLDPVAVKCGGPACVTDKSLWLTVAESVSAEATVLEPSGATGSGLPICCISGLAVAEDWWVERMLGPWRRTQSPNFFGGGEREQLFDFFVVVVLLGFFLRSDPADRRDASREQPENVLGLCATIQNSPLTASQNSSGPFKL